MGMFDTLSGVPNTHDNQVKCWDSMMNEYEVGDQVPSLGVSVTYSIRLQAKESGLGSLYAIVQEKRLISVASTDPYKGAPVFDKHRGYLGHGSEHVPRPTTQEPLVAWTVKKSPTVCPSEEGKSPDELATHTLRLRPDYTVKLKLPLDLTKEEAQRLALWVSSLPF